MKYFLLIPFLLLASQLQAATWQVGPGKTYTKPSQVMALVANGDTVEIDAATYIGDVGAWQVDDLVIRGAGGRPHLRANGNYAWGKGIWVAAGNNLTVENIEFSEASVPDQNGAGIRLDGEGLIVRNCYFHNNENGILTNNSATNTVVVENSEFGQNGYGDGYSHNIYVGRIASFTLRSCYMHHAYIGHNVKSRAAENFIEYNRIMDETSGQSSMLLDLPNGGFSLVIGNLFMQGASAENNRLLTYGVEGLSNTDNRLFVVNNTFVNERFNGNFVTVQAGAAQAELTNNIFVGPGNMLVGTAVQTTNLSFPDAASVGFVNAAVYDYRLLAGASSIDVGTVPGMASAYSLVPQFMYLHPTSGEPRNSLGLGIDVGAYEFDTPLAAELTAFETRLIHSGKIQLNWTTATEVDLDYFVVERSFDGNNWERINTVNAQGVPGSYQAVDERPFSGENYYRLAMYAEDEALNYSEIISIKTTKDTSQALVFPNPLGVAETLNFSLEEQTRFQLFDLLGRLKMDVLLEKDSSISLGLETGIYFYRIGKETGKLVVE